MPEQDKPVIKSTPSPDYEKKMSDLNSGFDNLFDNFGNSVAQQAQSPYKEAQTYSYNAKSDNPNSNFEHYYSHPSFDKLGFNPWRDNESNYAENASTAGDIWRATKAAGNLAQVGFKSAYRSYADLFTGNALNPDYESADEMKYWTTVGSSSKGGVSGFTSNLITNSGYTLGLIGSMALETAGLIGLESLTGGAATPLAASRLGKYGKDFGKIGTTLSGLTETMDAFKNYGTAQGAWKAVKTTGKLLNPLENLTGIAKNIDNFKDLTDLAKVSKTAGAFFRDLQAANLTLAEAKIEGASAERDLEDQLTQEYKAEHNGVEPPLEIKQQIKEAAQDAGMKTLAWNIPTIYLTNKITFDPLLNPVENAVKGTARFAGSEFLEKEGKGIVKSTLRNSLTASLKPRNLAGNTINYFKSNLSEGLQETLQEVISGTAEDYYKTLYKNASKQGLDYSNGEYQNQGVWDALSKNVTDQFSGKGFETFASGFLMGGLVGVAGKAATLPYKAFREYRQTKNEYKDAQLTALNEIYSDPLKYFSPVILNYSNGTESVLGQNKAEQEGNQREWLDHENQNLTGHVMTALETGTYDIFLDKLNRIKTMDPKAIQDAYGIEGNEVLSKIDKIIGRAERVKNNYEVWNDRYQNPFNPRNLDKSSEAYKEEALGYVSWEAAKKLAVFNDTTFSKNLDRIQDIHDDLLAVPGLKNISGNDIALLLNLNDIKNELRLLNDEIEVLENAEVPADRGTIKTKKAKLKALQRFNTNLHNYYLSNVLADKKIPEASGFTDTFKKTNVTTLKKSYEDYILHLAESQSNATPVNSLDIQNSFQKILDTHDLKQDNIYYSDAVNILANPKNFVDQYKRLNKVFKDLYETREDDIKISIETTQSIIEDNSVLKALFDRGVVLSSEDLNKLIKEKLIPTRFYDINSRQIIDDRNSKRYQELVDIASTYAEVTKPEQSEEEKVKEFAERIRQGEKLTDPEDLQFYENNKESIESELSIKKEEPPTPNQEVTETPKKLDINIVKKFDNVKNGQDLENLSQELTTLMRTVTLDEYNRLGLNAKVIDDMLKSKELELQGDISLDNLSEGDLISLFGYKNDKATIIRKSKSNITVKLLGEDTKITINEPNLKKTVKFKYSDTMIEEQIEATKDEINKVKDNSTKVEKLLENKEILEQILEEALNSPEEFEKQFMEELGCK